jgi:hypothetical protein
LVGATVRGLGPAQQQGAILEAHDVTLSHGAAVPLGPLKLGNVGEEPGASIRVLPQVPGEVLEGVGDPEDRQEEVLVLLRSLWDLLDVESGPGALGQPEGQDGGCGESGEAGVATTASSWLGTLSRSRGSVSGSVSDECSGFRARMWAQMPQVCHPTSTEDFFLARRQWLTPVILATQETEIRRIEVQSQPRQTV